MREFSSRILDDELTPEGSLRSARHKAVDLVMLELPEAGTKEAAIYSLARRYRLGPWLKRLWRGDRVTVHLYLYLRLERALDTKIAEAEKRVASLRAARERTKAHAASVEIREAGRASHSGGGAPRLALVAEPAR